MAKVSLRIYNQEIENLVDSGQLDEAIAHCRHILNTFPKHLETYRMIGKAYLEAKRYNEATEIFERLLMAVPDDFVAHVGMSIIHDEQKDMDAAIWHMQRAFEVQPSNSAIQAELQRLYGRRDGIEPPKIRLTRGALAHMYVQGELYPQAIAEIDHVLEEDPDRQDMQVLLARAYFHAGQKNEAADMCSQLLRRYPYCFDANRVLVELLPQTEQADSVQTYRKRVNELDPYVAFVTGSVLHTNEVPDAAVSLERLEWDGRPVDMGPEWGETKGIGLGETPAASDEEPDWLKSAMASEALGGSTVDEPASASGGLPIPTPSAEEDDIPDFLREAGWGKDTGTFQEGQVSFDDSDDSSEDLPLAEGDLPDWVKAMDPTGGEDETVSPQAELPADRMAQDDVPDWLQDLGEEQSESSEEQPLAEGEIPDWLEPAKPAEESASEQGSLELPVAESTRDENLPDWLKDIQSGEDDTAQEPAQEMPREPAQETQELSGEDLSDWQFSDEGTDEGSSDIETGELGTTAAEQDDAIAWLESLASKHGAKPEELVTDPNARSETEPDWVQKAKATPEQAGVEEPVAQEETPAETPEDLPDFLAHKQVESAEETVSDADIPVAEEQPLADTSTDLPDFLAEEMAETTEEPAAEAASDLADLGTSAQEQDDAVAWLESLASKHGAKPEELVTDPESRKETAPEWVQKASESGSENAVGERPTAPPSEGLEELAESVLGEQEGEAPDTAAEEVQSEEPVSSSDTDETGIWLQELAEEESLGKAQEPADETEAPATEDGDIPDWLREMEGESPQTEAARTSADDSSLPDWLKGVDAASTEAEDIPTPEPDEEALEPEPEPVSQIDINTASIDELASLPGIGDLLAQNIVAHREAYGGFSSLDDLSNVAGIGPSTIDELRGQVKIEKQPDITDWLRDMETESSEGTVEEPQAETADEPPADDLPSWLADIDKESEGQPVEQDDDLPDWLRGEVEEEPAQPQPTTPADWQPADVPTAQDEPSAPEPESKVDEPASEVESEAQAESESEVEEPVSAVEPEVKAEAEESVPTPEPVEEDMPVQAAPPPESEPEPKPEPEEPTETERSAYQEPVTRSRTGMTGILSDVEDPAFTQAQSELTRGEVNSAMESYSKLIKKGKMLDEIIFDLREALYRYPVEVIILQTLGDAYMKANRLQEALDSYTKAEELLR
ncbi:MAG: helix-hairpin-helix domain-containing protein [Anaerolineales bacterium]